jgi:hypothetical protein
MDNQFKEDAIKAVRQIPLGEWDRGESTPDPRRGGFVPKVGVVRSKTAGGAKVEIYHTGGPIEPVEWYLDVEGIEVARAHRYSAEFGRGGKPEVGGDTWLIEFYEEICKEIARREEKEKIDEVRRRL